MNNQLTPELIAQLQLIQQYQQQQLHPEVQQSQYQQPAVPQALPSPQQSPYSPNLYQQPKTPIEVLAERSDGLTQTQGQLIGISNELVQRVNQLSQENVRLASRVKSVEDGLTKLSIIVCGAALLGSAIFITSLVVSNAPSAPTNQPVKTTK